MVQAHQHAYLSLFLPCPVIFTKSESVYETCYVYMGAILSYVPFWLIISKGVLFYAISSFIFDSSKLCNLMLFLPCPVISAKSVKLLLFVILPCTLEHVLVISGDSSVFMFCNALPVHHVHAFFSHFRMP